MKGKKILLTLLLAITMVALCTVSLSVEVQAGDLKKCENVTVDRYANPYPSDWHTYGWNYDHTQSFAHPGAYQLKITFSRQTCAAYDAYIYIYDGEGKFFAKDTGYQLAGETLTIPGDSFSVRLISYWGDMGNGYSFDSIEAIFHNIETEGNATGRCTQHGEKLTVKCAECDYMYETGTFPIGHTTTGGVCQRCNTNIVRGSNVPETGATEMHWALDEQGTLTIFGTGSGYYYDSMSQPWYNWRDEIRQVVIEEGITKINNGMFSGCRNLQSVTIGESVTTIGSSAFRNCSGLQSVTIPDSVTEIAYYTFQGSGLQEIIIPDSVTSIGGAAFSDCNSLQNITIPDSVTAIGSGAFEFCYSLQDVYITDPNAWCNIDFGMGQYQSYQSNPMYRAKKLHILDEDGNEMTNLVLNDTVTTIPGYAFKGCDSLQSVTVPDSVAVIGDSAFSDCDGLRSVTVPDAVTTVGARAFSNCDNLIRVKLGENVTNTGAYLFSGCTNLARVTMSEKLKAIGEGMFSGCSSLSRITIPESVTSIGSGAFYECYSLSSVNIPTAVTSVGAEAFWNCRSLTEVHITDLASWCKIDFLENPYSFVACSNPLYYAKDLYLNREKITHLVIPESVTTIKMNTFAGGSFSAATIHDNITQIGKQAFYCCENLKEIQIPNNVKIIGEQAFKNCFALKKAHMPSALRTIGSYAFTSTALQQIDLPQKLTTIGEKAFSDCDNLTQVTIPGGVVLVGAYAFEDCNNLCVVRFEEGVEQIGNGSFQRCPKLTCVALPESLWSVVTGAFAGDNAIHHVLFAGPEYMREEMIVGNNNDALSNATWHYNCDGSEVTIDFDCASILLHCTVCNQDFTFNTDNIHSYEDGVCVVCGNSLSKPGDLTGDDAVNNDDVVLLLWHTLFPEDYPLTVDADLNGDSNVNNDDVVLLLWHTLFPEDYPL